MGTRKETTLEMDKEVTLPIRMRTEQRERLDLAAAIQTVSGPHRVGSGPLLLEVGLPEIDKIIAGASPEVRRQAQAMIDGRR